MSIQPGAGSQGEFAGLLTIRAWHESRGEGNRDVCLIPSSAHGTNPASAAMAGYRVVVVGCDRDGNVDIADLEAKAALHSDRLAALMVTYPSTHGVFETEIGAICRIVHGHGGQVYMDGANMNAQLGLTSAPAPSAPMFVTSICTRHSAFRMAAAFGYRPDRRRGASGAGSFKIIRCAPMRSATGFGPVSAAPFGSANVLPIRLPPISA